MKIRPFTMLLTMLAGWINRHQQDIIEYLKTENTILRSKIAKERIILNDQQRKLLTVLGKKLGQITCLVWVNGFQKPHFTSTRRFFHHHTSKRVIACRAFRLKMSLLCVITHCFGESRHDFGT